MVLLLHLPERWHNQHAGERLQWQDINTQYNYNEKEKNLLQERFTQDMMI